MRDRNETEWPKTKRETRAYKLARWARMQPEILLDLANLPDNSCKRFRMRFVMLDVSVREDKAILELRDQLQKLWRGDVSAGDALGYWVLRSRQEAANAYVVSAWGDGTYSVEPNHSNFPLCLALAASAWGSKMAICENPECPQKYFLKGRKAQRFCDRPACSDRPCRRGKIGSSWPPRYARDR